MKLAEILEAENAVTSAVTTHTTRGVLGIKSANVDESVIARMRPCCPTKAIPVARRWGTTFELEVDGYYARDPRDFVGLFVTSFRFLHAGLYRPVEIDYKQSDGSIFTCRNYVRLSGLGQVRNPSSVPMPTSKELEDVMLVKARERLPSEPAPPCSYEALHDKIVEFFVNKKETDGKVQ